MASLRHRGRFIGTLTVFLEEDKRRLSEYELALLRGLMEQGAQAIVNAQMHERLSRLATIDPLTDLLNHRALMDRLEEEMARARRNGHPLAVLLVDIDDFKAVNGMHGYLVGDWALRAVARVLRESLRLSDVLGRYAGDEFLAILPGTDREGAMAVARRVVDAVRNHHFSPPLRGEDGGALGDVELSLHVSCGVAIYPHDSTNKLELVSLADAAMYASKRVGGYGATLVAIGGGDPLGLGEPALEVLEGLIDAVDVKDRYTRRHAEQVARGAMGMAEVLGLDDEIRRLLGIAGLLHDVGKIGIPDAILRKPGPLTEEERLIVEKHPLIGVMIIGGVPKLAGLREVVRYHHERYDGKGYPRGLARERIPLMARIVAVADAYSAMVLDRPYRRALALKEAAEELRRGAGTQFDPELVEAFLRWLSGVGAPFGTNDR